MSDKHETEEPNGCCLRRILFAGFRLAFGFALIGFGSWTKAASAQTLPTVTIGKAVDTISFTVVDVALAEGYFEQNGVNVKIDLLGGSSAANAAMVGGSLQFVAQAANTLMLARSHNVPIIAIDSFDDGIALQLIASTRWLSAHPKAADASFEQKMANLNGAILAEVGTQEQALYGLLRSQAGLPKQEGYRLVHIDSQAAVAVAIQRGLADVSIMSPPISVQLVQQGHANNVADRNNFDAFNDVASDILATTASYANEHPDITRSVATAIAQALNFMRDHPDETLALDQKHFPTLDKTVLQESLHFIPFTKDGMQSQQSWDKAVAMARQTGIIEGVTNAPEGVYWTNKYIDTAKLGH